MDPIRVFSIISWIALPTVMFGGYSLLRLLAADNTWLTPFREKYFRAGHAHAGVLLLLSLLYYIYLAQTTFSGGLKLVACIVLVIGILAQSGGFFLHMLVGKQGRLSSGNIVTILGALLLAFAALWLAVGLIVAHT
jgi:heme/copper-type cytochrome/quinol oxidase subunit 4